MFKSKLKIQNSIIKILKRKIKALMNYPLPAPINLGQGSSGELRLRVIEANLFRRTDYLKYKIHSLNQKMFI